MKMISGSSEISGSRSDDSFPLPDNAMTSPMWNIRMRASKQAAKSKAHRAKSCLPIPGLQPQTSEIHISGAETICSRGEIQKMVREYVDRAIAHPRGKPDSIVVTIERLNKPLRSITALPLMTVKCGSSAGAIAIINILLRRSGVSIEAITSALSILRNKESMRGASLVRASSGRRVEPDMQRGVRASRFGIARPADKALSSGLSKLNINTQTVREALVLASKVASCRDIVAEVCISDDPDYTTGYVASASLGYIRIPHIKKKRDRRGGRIFFIKEDADVQPVMQYLERTPAMIQRIKPCSGEKTIDEILDRYHK
ncbi:MAG: 6-carboxyhexanoate--CoA ligase [Nitrospirae bacterium]|nr:6-carboxyhexanoate--CoA ligase [Nitrospirota bacterium]